MAEDPKVLVNTIMRETWDKAADTTFKAVKAALLQACVLRGGRLTAGEIAFIIDGMSAK